ncbi:hypothetical protein TVAG_421070 [Trichomonas vaginalis G3]|uniref:UBR-type domain-containing protein n=1 Tax=Trichomonas vaginalis (strain ATCC PRA-98 / G3) TaxID=412133 RepID=A2EVT2_TRIV3|nr:tricorn protease domain 2 family [Trichomonas vaginalis G3]EAY03219.1 hypothetical protein TVAG_421070 [Trichomonas vaginalis G3]KAI5550817.1 tricorn protease domain 2 family [Trichomonas vaginalis G3]|eukprot:XP_001315442.1 hypothetical protein [Trichomonas vaginalis G3]
MEFGQKLNELINKSTYSKEDIFEFFDLLSSVSLDSIENQNIKINFLYYRSILSKLFSSIKNIETSITSEIGLIATTVQKYIELYRKVKEADKEFPTEELSKLLEFQAIQENIAEIPKFSFNDKQKMPNYEKFCNFCIEFFQPKQFKFVDLINLAFYFNKNYLELIPNFSIDILQNCDKELFTDIELSPDSFVAIPEMVPPLDNVFEIDFIQYIYQSVYGYEFPEKIYLNYDVSNLLSNEKFGFLLHYFKFNPILDKDIPLDTKQTILLLMNNQIEFSKESISIPTLITPNYIALAYYSLEKHGDTGFYRAIINQSVYGKFWLASKVISGSYLNPNLLISIKELQTKPSAASNLIGHPEILPYLDLSNKYHRRMKILLSEDNEFPTEINVEAELALYKLKEKQNQIIQSNAPKYLKLLAETVRNDTIKDTKGNGYYASLLCAGFLPPIPDTQPLPIFKKPEELIEDQPFYTIVSNIISIISSIKLTEISDDVSILLCHRYISKESKQSLVSSLGNQGEQLRNKYMCTMMAFSMLEADYPISAAYKIKTISDVPTDVIITIVKFLENDLSSLCEFFGNTPEAQNMFNRLSEDSRRSVLVSLIRSENNDPIQSLSLDLEDPKTIQMILELSGKESVSHPTAVSQIMERILPSCNDISYFFDQIPENIHETTTELISLLSLVLDNVKHSDFVDAKLQEKPEIDFIWKEDINKIEKVTKDIWSEEFNGECHFSSNNKWPAFICYTCPENPIICLECATKCHKNHDLVCIGYNNNAVCHCDKYCTLTNSVKSQNSSRKRQTKQNDQENKILSVNPNSLAKFVIKLSNCKSSKVSDKTVKLHSDIKTCDLKSKTINPNYPPLIFSEIPQKTLQTGDGTRLRSSLENVNESFTLTHRRSEVSPAILCCQVLDGRFVLVGIGCKLTVLTNDLTSQLFSVSLPKVILSIKPSVQEPNLIVVTSLHNCYLYEISDNGQITLRNEVELRLNNIDSSLFINNVQWIPDSKYLMITTNCFVTFYDPSSKKFFGHVTTKQRVFYTSSTIICHNKKYYCLVSSSDGKIGIYDLSNLENSEFDRYSNFKLDGQLITLSSCLENNLCFISQGVLLHIIRPSELFSEKPSFLTVMTEFPSNLYLVDVFNGVFVFGNTNTNALFTLEFTDSGLEFECLQNGTIPIGYCSMLNNSMILLSAFVLNNSFVCLTNHGQFVELKMNTTAETVADKLINDDDFIYEEEKNVEPFFWARTLSTDLSKIEVKDYDGNNINDVLQRKRYIFSSNSARKSALVTLNDSENVIVGFRVGCESQSQSHRPPWISVLGRKVNVNSQRSFMFALKPNEIEPRKTYEIRFGSKEYYDTNFDFLDVFVCQYKIIKEICENSRKVVSFDNSNNLSDFKDSNTGDPSLYPIFSRLEKCFVSCAKNEKLSEEIFTRIVQLIYENDSLSSISRKIASLCSFDNKNEIWSKIASNCVEKLSKTTAKDFWRDFNLMNDEDKTKVSNDVWKGTEIEQDIFDPNMIVSAFISTN